MNIPEERARLELEKNLKQSGNPEKFFRVLDESGHLEIAFPEIAALKDVPAGPTEWHEEGSAFEHTMMVLSEMQELRPNDELALLMSISHDLGKAKTPRHELPSHPDHGRAGLDVIESMASRLSMSNLQQKVMKDAARWHMPMNSINELRESTVIDLVQKVHDPARLVSLAQADARGRRPQGEFDAATAFRRFANASAAIDRWSGDDLIEQGYNPDEMGGENFGNLLHQKRVELMRSLERSGSQQ